MLFPAVASVLTSPSAAAVHPRLLIAAGLHGDKVVLSTRDIETALADLHLGSRQHPQPDLPGVVHPSAFLPAELYAAQAVEVSHLVREQLRDVLAHNPSFCAAADELLGNDEFFRTVYFGTVPRDEGSIGFAQLSRRLVGAIHVYEALISLGHDAHRDVAQWHEALLRAQRGRLAEGGGEEGPRAPRERLFDFFLALKGESVVASLNLLAALQGQSARGPAEGAAPSEGLRALRRLSTPALSDMLNDCMASNIFEAVLANLSFARWPDNARAGLALLLARPGPCARHMPNLGRARHLPHGACVA